MVGSEDAVSNESSFECISGNTTNITLSNKFTGGSSSIDDLDINDSNAEVNARTDSIDDLSLNTSRATLQYLMEAVKIELILEMKNMIEESRKETKRLIEENRKEMKSMVTDIQNKTQE